MRGLLVLLVAVACVPGDPVVIKSGMSNLKDQAEHQDANVFDTNSAKGVANYEGEEGFHHANEGKHVQAQEQGKFNQENAEKNAHTNQKGYAGDNFHQTSGGEVADFNKKSANKKGHHKSGYNKSFHKDETASTSSYYDDSDNEDNQFVQNNKKNLYGDSGQHTNRGADYDDRRYGQDQSKNGYYNNAGNFDRDVGNRKDYSSKNYYDNKQNEGRRNAAKSYGAGHRYDEEQYYKKPPHYYGHDDYYQRPKKKITIYEDPRYDGYEKYPAYDNDYIQLELKRPPRDYDYRTYYDRRPYYDYYY